MHHWMEETHVSSRGSLLIIAHTFHAETKLKGIKTGIYSSLNNGQGSDYFGD